MGPVVLSLIEILIVVAILILTSAVIILLFRQSRRGVETAGVGITASSGTILSSDAPTSQAGRPLAIASGHPRATNRLLIKDLATYLQSAGSIEHADAPVETHYERIEDPDVPGREVLQAVPVRLRKRGGLVAAPRLKGDIVSALIARSIPGRRTDTQHRPNYEHFGRRRPTPAPADN